MRDKYKYKGDFILMKTLGRAVIVVKDYQEAIDFYTNKLGFEVFVDIDDDPLRYVHIRLPDQPDVGLWLLKAMTEQQLTRVGTQTAGLPCAVLYTDDLQKDYRLFVSRGVNFTVPPTQEPGSTCAHFEDLYGNEFVLVQLDT